MSSRVKRRANGRGGFTVLEMVLAFTIMVVVMAMTAQVGYWVMKERMRSATREAALNVANNILEAARATPWGSLTPAWAKAQQLPQDLVQGQPDAKLDVQVTPDPSVPRGKRVTVTIRWDFRDGVPPQELQMVSLFADREALEARKGP